MGTNANFGDMFSGFATGGITSLINNGLGLISNKQNFDNTIELWRRNNEYNSPKNQMKRLEEAGLNPNLVYGHGSVVGNTSSMPQAPAWRPTPFELDYTSAMLGKNLEKAQADINYQITQNKLLKERLKAVEHNNSLFLGSRLPTTTPWWFKLLANGYGDVDSFVNQPSVNKWLQRIGGSFFRDNVIYDDKPLYEKGDIVPVPEWKNNGKVKITYR